MRRPSVGWILFASCLALATGCQPISIRRVENNPATRANRRAGEILPPRPAPMGGGNARDPAARLARAWSSYRAALESERDSKGRAARLALDAVVDSSAALETAASDPLAWPGERGVAEAVALHNAATREALRLTSGRRIKLDAEWRAGMAARGSPVSVLRDAPSWDPDRFDEFLLADDYAVKGVDPQFRSDGLGVPLIGLRRFRFQDPKDRPGEEKFLMPRQVYPMTALLRVVPPPPGQPDVAPGFRLELRDPLLEGRVEFAGGPEPLASDLTTPLVYHFARSPLPILQEVGLLDPQWLEKLAGLYMLHPYEPGKIPVILVHGLRSSPAAWTRVINEIQGDPRLRDRYQIWLFLYPTGTPFPASAAKLRGALDELRQVVDPGRADRALDRTVLVGHSMGGLISKMLVLGSGDAFWKLASSRPFEELRASPERKEMLRNIFFFEPHPSIGRVVFIATPHRGSELGDQFIGRLADRLIRLPSSLRSTYRTILAQNAPDFFTPEIRAGLPSSIDELRRDNRLLLTLAGMPIGPGVVAHSIIGQEDPVVPIEEGSDGVVPYASSHIDWAASELVVRGDHGCQDTPETIREIRRILYLHLGKPRHWDRGIERPRRSGERGLPDSAR